MFFSFNLRTRLFSSNQAAGNRNLNFPIGQYARANQLMSPFSLMEFAREFLNMQSKQRLKSATLCWKSGELLMTMWLIGSLITVIEQWLIRLGSVEQGSDHAQGTQRK